MCGEIFPGSSLPVFLTILKGLLTVDLQSVRCPEGQGFARGCPAVPDAVRSLPGCVLPPLPQADHRSDVDPKEDGQDGVLIRERGKVGVEWG